MTAVLLAGIVDRIAGLEVPALYLVVGGLALGETAVFADFLVPGEVGMVVAATAARRATDAQLWLLICAGAVGATIGDSISYALGRRFGRGLVDRWRWSRRTIGPKLERAQGYFDDRGGLAVFAARWIGPLRAVMPVVAGASEMPYRRFLPWNVAASIAWVGTVVTLGWYVGDQVVGLFERLNLFAALALGLAVVAFLAFRWWRKHRRSQRSGD